MVTQVARSAEPEQTVLQDLVGVRLLVIMPSIPLQGMERANLQIMKLMRERGADILFVTERNHGEYVQRGVEQIGCRWAPATIIKSVEEQLHLTKKIGEMALVLRAWTRAAWEIDRIYKEYKPTHIYVTSLAYMLYALPTLMRAWQPVIFRLPNPPSTRLSNGKQVLSNWVWRYCVAQVSDVVVCNSQYTMSQLEKAGVKPKKAKVIYNCVPERIHKQTSDAPKVNPGQLNIVYLGRIRPEKGVKELFEAALQIVHEQEDIDFYFAGEYHWMNPFADSLIEEVRRKNLNSRIHFTGQIEDIFKLLEQCHLHVCPSTSAGESFPNVLLEAKSRALPSVVFPTAGIPEVVTHFVDGYVCSEKSAQALYDGIMYFLNDREALKSAGKAAKQSLGRFSKGRVAEEWASIFKSVC